MTLTEAEQEVLGASAATGMDLPLIVPSRALANARVRELVAALVTELRADEPEATHYGGFTPNLAGLELRDLVAAPGVSVANRYARVWVGRDEPIAGLTERHTRKPYVPGQTFYPLIAQEFLRAGREVAVTNRETGVMAAGPGLREVLKIPAGDITVTPGNHGPWDVFLQSGSPNRKLRRGTFVLIDPDRTVPIKPTWEPAAKS